MTNLLEMVYIYKQIFLWIEGKSFEFVFLREIHMMQAVYNLRMSALSVLKWPACDNGEGRVT